jgi:hypothetical protein
MVGGFHRADGLVETTGYTHGCQGLQRQRFAAIFRHNRIAEDAALTAISNDGLAQSRPRIETVETRADPHGVHSRRPGPKQPARRG